MPYKSDAQRRFFHSPGAAKAGITSGEVHEFDQASKGMKLPEYKAEGGEAGEDNEGHDEQLLNGVAQELLNGLEKKDKSMIVDAISALIAHIQTEDMKQDGQE